MTFQKYSSLENHTNSKFIAKVFELIMDKPDTQFIARSKIHGTNFSVIITKDSISPAKRTGPIGETEKFFGYEDLMAKYADNFRRIQDLTDFESTTHTIQIFGEYAGGNIQKEVDYGDKEFYVFDILIDGKYISDTNVESICSIHGFKMCPKIAVGALEDLLKLPVEYNSVIPEYNRLCSLYGIDAVNGQFFAQPEANDNVEEGLVIKPIEPMFFSSGSRVAIKYKTDAFKEKGKGKAPKIPVPLPPEDLELLNEFSKYVTVARIKNVVSHIGEITSKDFGKVMGLTMRDIFVEAGREGITINGTQHPSKLKGELQKILKDEIRAIWIDLIN